VKTEIARTEIGFPALPALSMRYWPCLGPWPLIVALVLAAPLALWARRDAAFPSSVSCTTAFKTNGWPTEQSCTAHDSHDIRSWTQLPCNALSAAFEGLLQSRGPLNRPLVYIVESDPAGSKTPLNVPSAIDPTVGVDANMARALLTECVNAPPATGAPRTVQVMVLDRDYLPSALVLASVLLVVFVLGLRRRVRIDVDPAQRFVLFVERGFVRERRTTMVKVDDIADVVVAAGASGFLSGRRVEIVRNDEKRVLVTEHYVPLTFGVHEQAARRLKSYVEGLRRC
jgi:hypothetical protein